MEVIIMLTFLTDLIGIVLMTTASEKLLENRLENMAILVNSQVMEQMLIYYSIERRKLSKIV